MPGVILINMENWAKGIGIACILCAALFFWVIAVLFEYYAPRSTAATLIITAIGLAFFVSPYYGIPAGLFGEELFLMETVISPNGIAGLLLSALFWSAVVILTVLVLHTIAVWWDYKKRGIQ